MTANAEALKELELAEGAVEDFLRTKTKAEVWENVLRRRILAAPVATAADIAADQQLQAREYFVEVESSALDRKLRLPGAFAKLSKTPSARLAPHRASASTTRPSMAGCSA